MSTPPPPRSKRCPSCIVKSRGYTPHPRLWKQPDASDNTTSTMEESSAKRRRVSPRTSLPDAPVKGIRSSIASASRRKRPSYASPTKASMARHNPEILERRRSASPSKPADQPSRPRRESTAGSDQSISDLLTMQTQQTTAEDMTASEPAQAHEDEPETHQDGNTPGSSLVTEKAAGGLSAPPRRSSFLPSPRPLPAPAPDAEDEINPFIGKTIRRSPNTGLPVALPPEPELPPAVDDPVSSTPPRGIHSSPSRWREKNRPKKSSPLKPRDSRPASDLGGKTKSKSIFAHRLHGQEPVGEPAAQLPLFDATTNPERRVPMFGSFAKTRERDSLFEEVAALKRDLEVANKENERIRLMQTSGRVVAPTNEDDVLDVVRRCLITSEEPSRPPQSQLLLQAALNPMGLLPFAKPTAVAAGSNKDKDDYSKIKSHYPVVMKAEEELPYLQLFTPFDITSTIAVLAPLPNNTLRQRRSMTLRSRDIPGLFTAKVAIVVNAANLSILELAVETLEPAAKPELGPFLERVCSGDCNRSMQRNVGMLSWAMGEWYRVAVQRAGFWSQLQRELESKEGLMDVVSKSRSRKRDRQEDGDARQKQQRSCSMKELILFMGQQSYEIKVPAAESGPDSSVRLDWRIGFDWTGEAQSKLGVMVGVPGKWREADQRGVFGRLPKLFENLVDGGEEPAGAVRTIVSLLAGEQA